MPKKAYTKDDNLMPDVSLPDDEPSQETPTNKKIDALPDVKQEKSTVHEEDIFDDTPKPKKKAKRNVKLEIEESDLDVKQGRRTGTKDSKPRKKRYAGGKQISQKALDPRLSVVKLMHALPLLSKISKNGRWGIGF